MDMNEKPKLSGVPETIFANRVCPCKGNQNKGCDKKIQKPWR